MRIDEARRQEGRRGSDRRTGGGCSHPPFCFSRGAAALHLVAGGPPSGRRRLEETAQAPGVLLLARDQQTEGVAEVPFFPAPDVPPGRGGLPAGALPTGPS